MAPGTLRGSGQPTKPSRQQQQSTAWPRILRNLPANHTLRHDNYKSQIRCQAHQQQQQQQQAPDSNSSNIVILRPIEVSREIAAARAAESIRSDCVFKDPYAAAFPLQQQQQQQELNSNRKPQQQQQQQQQQHFESLLDVIATRYIDDCLLNAMGATNVNTIQAGDYRQVVLLGDGMDCRPFRLPWAPGTVIFLVAPAEVHEQAEAQLAAAAAAAESVIPPAHVMRGCLLRRVNLNLAAAAADHGGSSSDKVSTIFTQELQRSGFRPDRLSVWAIQGLRNQGITDDTLRQLLTEVTNLAAFHSLLVGEIPGLRSKREVENILAEAGVLGAVVRYEQEDISYGRWQEAEQIGLLHPQNPNIAGEGSATTRSGDGQAPAAADGEVIQDRWLVTAQQLRLSLEQMGVYEEWSSEYNDNDMGDDSIGNFS